MTSHQVKSRAFRKHIARVRKKAGIINTPIVGLTNDKANAILFLYEHITNITQIAKFFQVSRPSVSDVVNRKTYINAIEESNHYVDRFNSGDGCGA